MEGENKGVVPEFSSDKIAAVFRGIYISIVFYRKNQWLFFSVVFFGRRIIGDRHIGEQFFF
jgi:hypothetical protein